MSRRKWFEERKRVYLLGHPPQEDTPDPAAVCNRFGAGRVVYFAQPLGQAYHGYGHPDFRTLLENAVRWAAGEGPPVEVCGPATVEAVLWEQPAEAAAEPVRYLHLVNRTPGGPVRTKASVITEEIPVFELDVRTRFPVRRALLQPGGRELELTADGAGVRLVVPRVDVHAIVELA